MQGEPELSLSFDLLACASITPSVRYLHTHPARAIIPDSECGIPHKSLLLSLDSRCVMFLIASHVPCLDIFCSETGESIAIYTNFRSGHFTGKNLSSSRIAEQIFQMIMTYSKRCARREHRL